MGRITRNKELLSAYKSPDANTDVKRVLLDAMDDTQAYDNIKKLGQAFNQDNSFASSTRMAGTALDDRGIDISPDSKRKRNSEEERVRLGDKDKRSFLAEEKIRIADDLVGGGYSRDQYVDMLNQGGQEGKPFLNALDNDSRIQTLLQMDNENYFMRPEMESPNFVGEGQFGRVTEFAPGFVSKQQNPLVEWGGYSEDNASKGNLIGRIHDYRDVQDEVDQLNYLNKRGKGITPKVESFDIADDGSTEMIMRDLRENYGDSDSFLEQQAGIFEDGNSSQKQKAQAFKNYNLFKVKDKQQQARAALLGVELQDRHSGNVMAHKMNNRPLQIDPSGRSVSGVEKDAVIIQNVSDGFSSAGLDEEANIFFGLAQEAVQRGDASAVHDLAQQGMSRLMKIKNVV